MDDLVVKRRKCYFCKRYDNRRIGAVGVCVQSHHAVCKKHAALCKVAGHVVQRFKYLSKALPLARLPYYAHPTFDRPDKKLLLMRLGDFERRMEPRSERLDSLEVTGYLPTHLLWQFDLLATAHLREADSWWETWRWKKGK